MLVMKQRNKAKMISSDKEDYDNNDSKDDD